MELDDEGTNVSRTLIQIISEETMPNLLAAMAIKPERIIHLRTSSMVAASKALKRAYAWVCPETVVTFVGIGDSPGMVETNEVVLRTIAGCENPVVNITGGTKLMSIGAYAAVSRRKVPSVYVDTASGMFVDGLSGGDFASLFPDGTEIARVGCQLTVDAVATANGVERVSDGKRWDGYAALADFLLRDPAAEQKCHKAVIDRVNGEPRDFSQAQAYFKKQYERPLKIPDPVGALGARAGLLEKRNGGYCPASSWLKKLLGFNLNGGKFPGHMLFEAIGEARWPFSFFNGNWWEIAVMRYLAEQSRYRDLRWSVDAGSRGGASTDMEEDILGIDGVNLLYVSCKRGGERAKLSRVLEDVNSSAKRIGGKFAHKMLAVYVDLQGAQATRLRNRCRDLRIDLLDRNTVASVKKLSDGA